MDGASLRSPHAHLETVTVRAAVAAIRTALNYTLLRELDRAPTLMIS